VTHGNNLKPVITLNSFIGVGDWVDFKIAFELISQYVYDIHPETNIDEEQYNKLLNVMTEKIIVSRPSLQSLAE
jgi:hypothetical protein